MTGRGFNPDRTIAQAALLAGLALCGASPGEAAIVGEASALASYKGAIVTSPAAKQNVPVSRGLAALELSIGPVSIRQTLPGLHEVGYALNARNTGTLTLNGLRFEEDLNADLPRARIVAGPWLDARGLSGKGGANPAFDGRSDLQMLAADTRLSPGVEAELGVRLHVLAPAGQIAFVSRVLASARQLADAVEARATSMADTMKLRENIDRDANGPIASKRIVFGPVGEPGGWALATYRLGLQAADRNVAGLSIRDNLAGVFGRNNYQVVSIGIASAPEAFGAQANPFFDGAGDTDLLTSGAGLSLGEKVMLDLTIRARVPGEERSNAMVARSGSSTSPYADARVTTAFPQAESPPSIDIAIASADQSFAPGDTIAYEMEIDAAKAPVDIVAHLPAGLTYLPGTGRVNGAPREPAADNGWLVWSDAALSAVGTRMAFGAVADPAAAKGRYVTSAFARHPTSGVILSGIAESTMRRAEEGVFDCTGITGNVFNDTNRDGFRQAGEPGIAGVKIALGNLPEQGVAVLSGRDGAYNLPCALIGRDRAGSAVEVGLAQPTLPNGYRPTTPLSRHLALRRGRVAHADFGAASLPVVLFKLDAKAFEDGSERLAPAGLKALARLIVRLERRPAILRIDHANIGDTDLAARRVEAVMALARGAWRAGERSHELLIETPFGEQAVSGMSDKKM